MIDKHFLFMDLARGDGRVTWKSYMRFCRSQGEPPPQPSMGILMVSGSLSQAELNSLRQALGTSTAVMVDARAYARVASNTVTAAFKFNWNVTKA